MGIRVATVVVAPSRFGQRTYSPRLRLGLTDGRQGVGERIASDAHKKPGAQAMGIRVATVVVAPSRFG